MSEIICFFAAFSISYIFCIRFEESGTSRWSGGLGAKSLMLWVCAAIPLNLIFGAEIKNWISSNTIIFGYTFLLGVIFGVSGYWVVRFLNK